MSSDYCVFRFVQVQKVTHVNEFEVQGVLLGEKGDRLSPLSDPISAEHSLESDYYIPYSRAFLLGELSPISAGF